jgi:hypothetical protein
VTEFISTLADASTIWLIILSFILCLIPLALVGGMVYGMRKLLGALPPVLKKGQEGLVRVADGADRASKRAAAPFITASASASQVKGMLRGLRKLIGGNHDLEK